MYLQGSWRTKKTEFIQNISRLQKPNNELNVYFGPRWNALSIISSPNKTTAVICRVRGPLTSSIVGRTVLRASVLTRTRAGQERREEDQQRRSWAVCVRDGSPGILRPTNNGLRPLVSLAKQIIGNLILHCVSETLLRWLLSTYEVWAEPQRPIVTQYTRTKECPFLLVSEVDATL